MKVLLIGGGGREHAIALALSQSAELGSLICAPGNAGIEKLAACYPDVKATDIAGIVSLAQREKPDFVVVAPDDPLALGAVDALEAAGFPAFGPTQAAARLESSKVFSKAFMRRHGIPTAEYETFEDPARACAYIESVGAPVVVKADGLALGKGVVVAKTVSEAKDAVHRIMVDKAFAASGSRVVIEECMTGREVTLLCFCDGKTAVPMPSSQDHKRAFDGDLGPNTGGMGAFAPSPYFTPDLLETTMRTVVVPAVAGAASDGFPFKGVLYVGLMLTPGGPRVIEFNARFGDPEAQAVLPLLKTDLLTIFRACREGRLSETEILWSGQTACCVALASGGYPGEYKTGYPILGIAQAEAEGATVYHAGTRAFGGQVLTAGGRVLGVTALGQNLSEAVARAYAAAERIAFEGRHMRTDIGAR